MTCAEFRQLLDDGVRSHEHASACASCAQLLRDELEIERLLGIVVPGVARADFNDSVMRRIHARRPLAMLAHVFAEPFVAVSLAIVSVLVWNFESLARMTVDASTAIASMMPQTTMAFPVAAVIAMISWRIFRMFDVSVRTLPAPAAATTRDRDGRRDSAPRPQSFR